MRQRIFFLFSFFLFFSLKSQTSYPSDCFISPVRIPIFLSGSFGELRSNHFHSGIDIRINEKCGEPVYAIADGFVSRIRISSSGVGKALYLDHPNGYRSVVFHLDKFEGVIADYVLKHQYDQETFEFDIFLGKEELKMKQGQMLARGGNSGSSGGPHVHFEIRHTHNDQIINPLYFGIDTKDTIPPVIREVRVYKYNPLNQKGSHTLVSNLTRSISKKVKGKNGKMINKTITRNIDTLTAWGRLYFGVDVIDKGLKSLSLGVPVVKWFVDDELIYGHDIETFEFSETRYINAMIDYPLYVKNRKKVILSRVLPGNNIRIIEETPYKGYYDFTDQKQHKVRVETVDFHGNKTQRTFYIQSKKPQGAIVVPKATQGNFSETVLLYGQKNTVELENAEVTFDEGTFFEDILFQYNRKKADTPFPYADLYCFQQEIPVPIFMAFSIKIKPVQPIPSSLQKKALIVRVNGKAQYSEGGKWDGEYLVAKSSQLGFFTIGMDTVAPVVQPLNFSSKKALQTTRLRISIRDVLSGIATYNVYINNQWILAEYDAKSNSIQINGNRSIKKGKNQIRVEVTDRCENKTSKQYDVIF